MKRMLAEANPIRLPGMVPFEVHIEGEVVLWADFGRTAFVDPFFHTTIHRYHQTHGPLEVIPSSLEMMCALAEQQPGLAPSGLIFHMSRCGSTLLAQMLAALEENVVIAEPQPLNVVLSPDHQRPVADRVRWLRGLVSALGQPRLGSERQLYLKCMSWNVLHLDTVLQAFPITPWLFVYREPIEVLVSRLRDYDATPPTMGQDNRAPEDRIAEGLADYCRTALRHAGPRSMMVNYRSLDRQGLPAILEFLGLEVTADQLERMLAMRAVYSKDPERRKPFTSDSESKQQAASPQLHALAERWLAEPYAELEALAYPA